MLQPIKPSACAHELMKRRRSGSIGAVALSNKCWTANYNDPPNPGFFSASAIGLKPAIGLPALVTSQREGKVNETG